MPTAGGRPVAVYAGVRERHRGWRRATRTGCARPANPTARTARAARRRLPGHRSAPGGRARLWHPAMAPAPTTERWEPRPRDNTFRASCTVSTTAGPGQGRPFLAQATFRNPTSNGALCATRTAPRMNSRNDGSTAPIIGASKTIASEIPVSMVICGGIFRPGSTSVANSPSTSPPRILTAPISVIDSVCDEPPVVSRSTTTNVTSRNGSPSSSKLYCVDSRGRTTGSVFDRWSERTETDGVEQRSAGWSIVQRQCHARERRTQVRQSPRTGL